MICLRDSRIRHLAPDLSMKVKMPRFQKTYVTLIKAQFLQRMSTLFYRIVLSYRFLVQVNKKAMKSVKYVQS